MSWRRRDAESFTHAFLALLPLGEAWPRSHDSELYKIVRGLMGVVGLWADRLATFVFVEAFPPNSYLLLPDWERILGLPEPCIPIGDLTLEERRLLVREKLARRPGSQSRAYFVDLARRLGYHEDEPSPYALPLQLPGQVGQLNKVRIKEFRPFMAGYSRVADPCWTIAPPRMRFVWRLTVPGQRLTWFRCGMSRAGQDPHLRIRRAEDLECIFRKYKPAHTRLIFSYSGA